MMTEHDKKVDKLLAEEQKQIDKFWNTYLAIRNNEITEWKGKQLSGQVGGIYPPDEEGGYDQANLGKCVCVEAGGGHFYAEIVK